MHPTISALAKQYNQNMDNYMGISGVYKKRDERVVQVMVKEKGFYF